MARPEWLRTFVAVYRAGSVTDAARLRGLSQPAASQQLAGLERAVGAALFVRGPEGMTPTERGRSLYGEVCSALDQLEAVLAGLDAGRVTQARPALRLGSSAELFSAEVLPRLAASALSVVAHFADDVELLARLEHGDLDVVLTSATPPRRSISAQHVGDKRFMLVGAPHQASEAGFGSLRHLGDWLTGQDWVAYSLELPVTRRFWQAHLDRPFSANLRLVAPDLRAVLGAVICGLGVSMLPSFVCAGALADGQIVELHPIADLVAPEPWSVCFRQGEASRPDVAALLAVFSEPRSEDGPRDCSSMPAVNDWGSQGQKA